METIKVLVACEESQAVCKAFRARGFEAYSCDVQECSGGHPEWHLQMDVFDAIDSRQWDAMIAHPPCTHLSVSGQHWFSRGMKDPQLREDAVAFVWALMCADISHIAVENPVSILSTRIRKPDQIVQPWMFGHGETKATCFWLKNLPRLDPTDVVEGREPRIWKMRIADHAKRSRERSKTFPGIAEAMARQWGDYLIKLYGHG